MPNSRIVKQREIADPEHPHAMVEEARVEILPRLRHMTAEQPTVIKPAKRKKASVAKRPIASASSQLHEADERDDELYQAARIGIATRYELGQPESLDQADAANVAIADTASAPSTTSSSERI